jgi:hypothetical protein
MAIGVTTCRDRRRRRPQRASGDRVAGSRSLLRDEGAPLLGSVGAGREPAVRRRAPHPCHRVAKDLKTLRDGKAELEQRRAKPLEQERAQLRIVTEQRHAPFTVSEPERCDLVAGGVRVRRQKNLHDDRLTVNGGRLCDICLGSTRERSADGDVPPLLEVAYNRGKLVEPRLSASDGCVSSEDVRDDQGNGTHECIMPDPRSRACQRRANFDSLAATRGHFSSGDDRAPGRPPRRRPSPSAHPIADSGAPKITLG